MVNDAFSAVREEILRIGKAAAARNYWSVLGIPPGSDYKQIKTAHRKWIRKLHPDRWFATTDAELYRQIHEAFYQVQVAYFETLKLCAARQTEAPQHEPIPMASPVESPDIPFFSWFIRLLQKITLGFFGQKAGSTH
jgi:hypothetical protein